MYSGFHRRENVRVHMPNSGVILSQGKVLYYQKITKAKNDTLIAPE